MAVIRNIILDWSGTLVDDFGPVLEATNEIIAQYGKAPMSAGEFRAKFKLPFTEFYAEHLPEISLPEIDHYYHTAFKLLDSQVEPLPHAREFLDWCQGQGLPLFLLSSIHGEHYRVQAARLGLDGYFREACVQQVDKRKAILRLLAEHDLEPGETMFVGDMCHDIDTARHGGVVGCAVLTGYDSLDKLKGSNPDLVFRHLGEVRAHLERHREEPPVPPPAATVGALIFNARDEVLMVRTHKWSDKWGIPGGKIQGEESALDALRRETREETGLALRDIRFELVQDCIRPPEFYRRAHFLLLNYTARVDGPDTVTLNDEAQEHQWLPLEQAGELDLNIPTRTLLDHVRSHSHQPA